MGTNPCDRCGLKTESGYFHVDSGFFGGWLCDVCREELRQFFDVEPVREIDISDEAFLQRLSETGGANDRD